MYLQFESISYVGFDIHIAIFTKLIESCFQGHWFQVKVRLAAMTSLQF